MDLYSIRNGLKNRFTVFSSEEAVKGWLATHGYTSITRNNRDYAANAVEMYIKEEMESRIQQLQTEIKKTVDDVLQDDVEVSCVMDESDFWGALVGGGGAAFLTLVVGGTILFPVALLSAFVGYLAGRNKMTNDFAREVLRSSNEIRENVCEKIEPIIDELVSKIDNIETKKATDSKKSYEEKAPFIPSAISSRTVYVKHKSYGIGKIISTQNNIMRIEFKEAVANFSFPSAFVKIKGSCWLDIVDDYENTMNAIQYFEENNLLDQLLSRKTKEFSYSLDNSWMQECAERKRLLDFIEKKGFVGFLHTTNFSNLSSIFQGGKLLSRNRLNAIGASFDDCAEVDIIERTTSDVKDSNRFYFRAKTPTNYSAFRYHGQKNPVVFALKKDCIFDRSVVFYDGNARATDTICTKSALVAYSLFNWNCIFSDVIAYENDETNSFLFKEDCTLSELKRAQNAEVLFRNELDLSLFDKIYFRTVQDYQNAVRCFGRDERFICDPRMFCL